MQSTNGMTNLASICRLPGVEQTPVYHSHPTTQLSVRRFRARLEEYSDDEITSTKISPSKIEFSDTLTRGKAKFYRMVVQD